LQTHPEFEPVAVSAPWFVEGENHTFRLWPHKLLGEGHFAAVLRKKGEEAAADTNWQPGEKLPKLWQEFAKALGISLPEGKVVCFGSKLFWAPQELPELRGLKVLRPGLELGEIKKDRFEPAHALALWLRECSNTVSFAADSAEIKAYLHGDVLPCTKRGWCLVQVDGYSIGWGKGDGNTLKNHYPKGLRR
jgi:NOL1/NOP2/fmu family ribosome biogenesis protein